MRDRDLVRLYWPVELRPAFDALFAIDDAMADIVASSTQAALGAIRLAWWRDALVRLDSGSPPPEPRLQAAVAELLVQGVTGQDLAALEEGWAHLLDEDADTEAALVRGERLFGMGAKLLRTPNANVAEAGRLFARADYARRGLAPLGACQPITATFERRLRPLTCLAALAARDMRQGGSPFEPEATPGRAARLLSHKLFGRLS